MATPEERSAAASEQMSVAMANLVKTLTAQQAAADKKARDGEKREAALKETTDMMAEALRENIKFDEDKAKEEKKKVVERQLLGLTEKQYEALLDQRKKAEETKKKLDETKTILEKNGLIAEDDETYQRLAAEHDELTGGNEEKRAERERKLLGLTEKQYEATLAQRKVAEDAKKELDDMKEVLGDSAESNEKYQKAKAKFDKEEAKAKKLEGRRGLLQRFKEKIPGTAAREAAKARDGDKQGGIFGKGFKSIGKLFAKFTAIFSLALLGLVALVNSPIFEKIKNALLDFVDFFADKVYPILLRAKDQLMGPLKELYDDFIKPLFTFIGDFLTRDGGGIDTLFEGFEKALENLMKIFKNVKDIFTGITEGDFSKVFNAVGDLLDNIVIALKDALGTAIKFILGFFKVDGKGKTGFQMLGGVVSNFFKSIAEGVGNLFKKAMRGIQSAVRAVVGDTVGDTIFGKSDETIAAEKTEEAKEAKEENIQRVQRELNQSKKLTRGAEFRVKRAQRDVDDDRKGLLNLSKDTEEDKRLEDIKLFNERERLEMIQEEQAALEGELAKAKAAPININAPTNNVVNQSKQESTITQPIAMVATGTAGTLARGGGSMTSGNE